MARDLVFLHGMFMNPRSWGSWVDYFSAKGYRCHAPAWPFHDGDPAELRKSPSPELGKLTFGAVLEAMRGVVAKLGEKPILVGHSMGGLLAQKLIAEGLGAAGVAIDGAPPPGIFVLSWSFLKSNLPVVNPLAGDRPHVFTLEQFHYAFCHTLSLDETRKVFDQLVVPESRNVPRSIGKDAKIDFARPHAPLLFVGGEQDHIVPWQLNQKNHAAYTDPASVTDFKRFPGRTHYLCGQTGWEEVAGFVHEWIEGH